MADNDEYYENDDYSDNGDYELRYSEDEEEEEEKNEIDEKKKKPEEEEDEEEDITMQLHGTSEVVDIDTNETYKYNIQISSNEMTVYEYDRLAQSLGRMIAEGIKIYPEMFSLDEMRNKDPESINQYVDGSNEIAHIWIKHRHNFPLPIEYIIREMPDGSEEFLDPNNLLTPYEQESAFFSEGNGQ